MAQVNMKQLEAFVQVADLGSFRRAAARLHTTQPNISSRISALEAQLQTKLMDRDAGSVRLTPVGSLLLLKARKVIRSMEDFLVAAGDNMLFDGVLRLGVTEMIVHSWLGGYLSALKSHYSNIDIELVVDLSANLSDALFNRSIDLALQSGPFNRQVSGSVSLGSFPMVWVAAANLAVERKVLALSDLANYPILTHARGTLPYEQLKQHVQGSPEIRVRLVPSTNMAACIEMTHQGLGVACLPAVMVRDEIQSGKLDIIEYHWSPDALSFWARYDADTSPHFVSQAAILAGEISLGDASEE